MKKKFLAFATVFALVAVAVVGGTMAYFTDKDDATNTFAVGGVSIELIEQQRDTEETGTLVEFSTASTLFPVVVKDGDAPVVTDENETVITLPTQANYANYIDKIVRVTNTGVSDAYVRVFIAVPASIDVNKGLNLSFGDKANWNNFTPVYESEDKLTTTIGDIEYNVYSSIYKTSIASDETTVPALYGVYLDTSVDCDKDGNLVIDGNTVESEDYLDANGHVNIPVFAQAIQTAGFDTAEEAFTASGLPENPWAE